MPLFRRTQVQFLIRFLRYLSFHSVRIFSFSTFHPIPNFESLLTLYYIHFNEAEQFVTSLLCKWKRSTPYIYKIFQHDRSFRRNDDFPLEKFRFHATSSKRKPIDTGFPFCCKVDLAASRCDTGVCVRGESSRVFIYNTEWP